MAEGWVDDDGEPTPKLQIVLSAALAFAVVFVVGLVSNILPVYAAGYALASATGTAVAVWFMEVYRGD